MNRHRTDPFALVAGIGLTAVALVALLGPPTRLPGDIGIVAPIGAIVLALLLLRPPRRRPRRGEQAP